MWEITYTASLDFLVDEGTSEASTECIVSTNYVDANKNTNMICLAWA